MPTMIPETSEQIMLQTQRPNNDILKETIDTVVGKETIKTKNGDVFVLTLEEDKKAAINLQINIRVYHILMLCFGYILVSKYAS